MASISLKNVVKNYRAGKTVNKVIHGVNADIADGEFVVIVAGHELENEGQELSDEQLRVLKLLLKECSTKTAAALAADITGQRKKLLYQAALEMQDESRKQD